MIWTVILSLMHKVLKHDNICIIKIHVYNNFNDLDVISFALQHLADEK